MQLLNEFDDSNFDRYKLRANFELLGISKYRKFFTLVERNSCKLPLSTYDINFFVCIYLAYHVVV